jgi:hypothetical protein
MTGAGWRLRPGRPDDRELLAFFAGADQAIRWKAEVEEFIRTRQRQPLDPGNRINQPGNIAPCTGRKPNLSSYLAGLRALKEKRVGVKL